jgi:superfamily II DNA or RNA helicase
VREHPHTAIICRYTEQIAIIQEELGDVLTLTGQTKARDSVIEKARTQEIPIIIQAQVSEGYELPEIEHVIFASMDWSYKNYVQMMGRFLRINAPTPTVFHRLISGDVDKRVLQSLNNKQDFYVKKNTTKTMGEEKSKAKDPIQRLKLFKG